MSIFDSRLPFVIQSYLSSLCNSYPDYDFHQISSEQVDMHRAISCLLNQYTDMNYGKILPLLKRYFWTVSIKLNPRVFILEIPLKDKNIRAILKLEEYTRHTDLLINELGIGLLINPFIGQLPSFVYTYAGFSCSLPYEDRPCSYLGNSEINGNYILTEYIPGDTLRAFCFNIPLAERIQQTWKYVCYLMYTVFSFNRLTKFSHNDLHFDNIIMKPLNQSTVFSIPYIPGKGQSIELEYLPVIIDYGRSNIQIYGPVDEYLNLQPGQDSLLDMTYIISSLYIVYGKPADFPFAKYISDNQLNTYSELKKGNIQPQNILSKFIQQYGYPFISVDQEPIQSISQSVDEHELEYLKQRAIINSLFNELEFVISKSISSINSGGYHNVKNELQPVIKLVDQLQEINPEYLTMEEQYNLNYHIQYMNLVQSKLNNYLRSYVNTRYSTLDTLIKEYQKSPSQDIIYKMQRNLEDIRSMDINNLSTEDRNLYEAYIQLIAHLPVMYNMLS